MCKSVETVQKTNEASLEWGKKQPWIVESTEALTVGLRAQKIRNLLKTKYSTFLHYFKSDSGRMAFNLIAAFRKLRKTIIVFQ